MTQLTFANKKENRCEKGAKDLAVKKAAGAPLCGKKCAGRKKTRPAEKVTQRSTGGKAKQKSQKQMQKSLF